MSLNDDINTWETKWCSGSEGMNPEMREELDEIHKAFIKDVEEENKDLESDVLDLLEITPRGPPPIAQMIKLFKAHKEEREKLAGEKLI